MLSKMKFTYTYIYMFNSETYFAVPKLISAVQNKCGLIRSQNIHTATQEVGIT